MFRAMFSLLLVANLLACPLRCIGCDAAACGISTDSTASALVSAGCACCHDACDRSLSESQTVKSGSLESTAQYIDSSGAPYGCPDDCPAECQCKNCLCEGATIQDGPELPIALLHSIIGPDREVFPLVERSVWRDVTIDHGWIESGRQRRIALQSWLI
ncbi:hypothetical protein NHH03_21210 [Stieleria sp. TO1_6]|uniref:hypothetical protein n=1 Tax=Stieleria tagensis TaxID=2956795 RepID=UPI00209B292D|nr:hypothetical protein [Stieleria tagensis]MCO8124275.1 hypothetical protein [Stieleria tagensis]